MPKLTGEELSKLYPKAKTYDELQIEREQTEEARRPRFVSLKVALWTTLIAVVAIAVYQAVLLLFPSFESGAVVDVMPGVCGAMLSALLGMAAVYYLYSLIDGVASKVFLNTALLYGALLIVLCICGGLGALLTYLEYSAIVVAVIATLSTFILSLLVTVVLKRFNS